MAYGSILGQTVEIPQPVNTVASGNMNAVTSNAVYQALQNLPAGVQIATGSYTGTGTFGSGNKKSLTFGFIPKIVFIIPRGNLSTAYGIPYYWGSPYMLVQDSSFTTTCTVTVSGNTMQFYGTSAIIQLNVDEETYYYIAIG